MLIVLTPATATRLTTVEAVVDRLGIDTARVTPSLDALIDVASQMAVNYCDRSFGLETVKQITPFWSYGDGILLDRSPATVIEVSEGGEIVAPDHYYLDPTRNVLIRLSDDGSGCSGWVGRTEITYQAGWILPGEEGANLPATIEHAVLLLIGAMWSAQQRDPLAKSESVDGIGRVDYWVPGAGSRLPDPTAEILLRPYRRYC